MNWTKQRLHRSACFSFMLLALFLIKTNIGFCAAPTLSWTDEEGLWNDGVTPDYGIVSSDDFTFKVIYSDSDNDASYTADPTLTGKAKFGFNSKYKKGANIPTGQPQFKYKVGNLNFHSSAYQWLVVAGARAQFKGEGTITGMGNYGFMLTGIDGSVNGGGGVDKFRIKIWDKDNSGQIVYDNMLDAPDDAEVTTTVIGSGQIAIHK